ncbi:MAG: arylsulfotransferase family protein [Planctomycetota bacterium]
MPKVALFVVLLLAGYLAGVAAALFRVFPAEAVAGWLQVDDASGADATSPSGSGASAGGRASTQSAAASPTPAGGRRPVRPPTDPRWHAARSAASTPDSAALEGLDVVPYLQGVKEAQGVGGVLVFDPQAAHTGLNLVTSGHAPEALLMDMKGNVLHRWAQDFSSVWPGPLGAFEGSLNTTYWRRVHLYPNGDLLAIFEGIGLVKLDRNSQVIWRHRGKEHHDLFVADDGSIYTLTRRKVANDGSRPVGRRVIEDFVTVLSDDGVPLREVSILDCIIASKYRSILTRRPPKADILHSNTIELLDGRHAERYPMFAAGHVLVSVRNLDMVAVLDLDRGEVVWAMTDLWRRQHQPTVLDNGHLLVFDNMGNNGKSRVLELDPLTHALAWSYEGEPDMPLESGTLGSCQRLPNGNTLITESEPGRVIEVTPEGDVVWEFINPYRAGEAGELIASLFEVVRLDWSYPQFDEVREVYEQARTMDLGNVEEMVKKLKRNR